MMLLCASALALASCAAPDPATYVRLGAAEFDGVKVTVSVKDQRIRIEAEGVKEVDFQGASAHVRLAAGQRLTVGFDAGSYTFQVAVLEDADGALDIAIGAAVIHATRGDEFDARVIGENLDVMVRRGIVVVGGQEIGQGSQITVSRGGRGAIHGVPPPAPPSRVGPKGPPREPRRPPILDRTDIAPAP